jgi:hypothetical protein
LPSPRDKAEEIDPWRRVEVSSPSLQRLKIEPRQRIVVDS